MKLILCTFCLIAGVIARPEAPIGYNYPAPSGISVGNSLGSLQIPSFSLGNQLSGLPGGTTDFVSNIGPGPGLSTSGHGGDFGISHSGPSIIQSGPATIHKHVYVHVAPEEPEEIHPRKPLVVGAPQKHYKIIFIKAPAPPKPHVPIIPPQPQNEEKTLVYVLVKKPEEAPEIHIPTPIPTQPAKPEVYFIKYGTKKEQLGGGSIGHISNGHALGNNNLLNQPLGDISNSLTHTEGASLGSSVGISVGPSVGPSVAPSFGSSIGGDASSQLSASVGISSSAGVSSKYGPPGYTK